MSLPPADLKYWAFSEEAPWQLSPGSIEWLNDIDILRKETKAEIPRLLSRSHLPPVGRFLKVSYELGKALSGWYLLDKKNGGVNSREGLSKRLRIAFANLGPTYIKLGQILSSGKGIFPEEVVSQFSLLRDKVPPESFSDVKETIERDLAAPLDAIFKSFDKNPVAAASIAQVHEATLISGEEVVVKVQRPNIGTLVRQDLSAMSFIAPSLVGRIPVAALANPPALVELFADTIVEELDFRLEAENMLDIARILAENELRAMIVPRPHPKLVTRRVLVMQKLDGFFWDDVEGMIQAGIDTAQVLRAGLISFFEGAMLYGVFHGDLHGGNLFVQPTGRVALLDFGITGRLNEEKRLAFMKLLIGASTSDIKSQIEAFKELGALPADVKVETVIKDLNLDAPPVDPTTMSADEIINEMQRIAKALLGYGAKLPKELMLFVKNMLFMDNAIANLAPDINLLEEFSTIAQYFAERHGEKIAKDIGIDPREVPIDLTDVKASFGLTPEVEKLSYRDIQKRREEIRRKFEKKALS
jgi:ubiquinone biosynthesis protein